MKVEYYIAKIDFGWRYIIPSIEYRRKYWYYWEISLSWWKWSVVIGFCKKAWNKNNEK